MTLRLRNYLHPDAVQYRRFLRTKNPSPRLLELYGKAEVAAVPCGKVAELIGEYFIEKEEYSVTNGKKKSGVTPYTVTLQLENTRTHRVSCERVIVEHNADGDAWTLKKRKQFNCEDGPTAMLAAYVEACTQVDIGFLGGTVKAHGGIGGKVSWQGKTFGLELKLGLGVSFGLDGLLRVSVFIEGSTTVTATLPKWAIKPLKATAKILKWIVSNMVQAIPYVPRRAEALTPTQRKLKRLRTVAREVAIGAAMEGSEEAMLDVRAIQPKIHNRFKLLLRQFLTRVGNTLLSRNRARGASRVKTLEKLTKVVESAFRFVILGQKRRSGYPKCSSLKYGEPRTLDVAAAWLCAVSKYGLYAPARERGMLDRVLFRKGSNKNIRNSMPAMFPELFPDPAQGPADEAQVLNAVDAIISMNLNIDHLDYVDDSSTMQINWLFLSFFESTQEKFDGVLQRLNGVEEESPNLVAAMVEFNFGITVGRAQVGFCSPDTNPLQFQTSIAGWKWDGMVRTKLPKVTTFTISLGGLLNLRIGYHWGDKTIQVGLRVQFISSTTVEQATVNLDSRAVQMSDWVKALDAILTPRAPDTDEISDGVVEGFMRGWGEKLSENFDHVTSLLSVIDAPDVPVPEGLQNLVVGAGRAMLNFFNVRMPLNDIHVTYNHDKYIGIDVEAGIKLSPRSVESVQVNLFNLEQKVLAVGAGGGLFTLGGSGYWSQGQDICLVDYNKEKLQMPLETYSEDQEALGRFLSGAREAAQAGDVPAEDPHPSPSPVPAPDPLSDHPRKDDDPPPPPPPPPAAAAALAVHVPPSDPDVKATDYVDTLPDLDSPIETLKEALVTPPEKAELPIEDDPDHFTIDDEWMFDEAIPIDKRATGKFINKPWQEKQVEIPRVQAPVRAPVPVPVPKPVEPRKDINRPQNNNGRGPEGQNKSNPKKDVDLITKPNFDLEVFKKMMKTMKLKPAPGKDTYQITPDVAKSASVKDRKMLLSAVQTKHLIPENGQHDNVIRYLQDF